MKKIIKNYYPLNFHKNIVLLWWSQNRNHLLEETRANKALGLRAVLPLFGLSFIVILISKSLWALTHLSFVFVFKPRLLHLCALYGYERKMMEMFPSYEMRNQLLYIISNWFLCYFILWLVYFICVLFIILRFHLHHSKNPSQTNYVLRLLRLHSLTLSAPDYMDLSFYEVHLML